MARAGATWATSPCTTQLLPPAASASAATRSGGVAVVEVVDGHVAALPREGQRHRAPDALLRPGDEDGLQRVSSMISRMRFMTSRRRRLASGSVAGSGSATVSP